LFVPVFLIRRHFLQIQLDGCAPIHGAPVLSVDSAAPNPKLHTARNGTMEHGEQLAMMQAKIDQLEAHTVASESKPQPAAHIQVRVQYSYIHLVDAGPT